MAHLIPKIRCQFAEFLNHRSSARLRIFISPTCVGLRYWQFLICLETFLGTTASAILYSFRRISGACHISETKTDLPILLSYILRTSIPSLASHSPMRPFITLKNWYRNINRFAIAYPFRTRLRTRLTLQ